jgi:hypothetical protein
VFELKMKIAGYNETELANLRSSSPRRTGIPAASGDFRLLIRAVSNGIFGQD